MIECGVQVGIYQAVLCSNWIIRWANRLYIGMFEADIRDSQAEKMMSFMLSRHNEATRTQSLSSYAIVSVIESTRRRVTEK